MAKTKTKSARTRANEMLKAAEIWASADKCRKESRAGATYYIEVELHDDLTFSVMQEVADVFDSTAINVSSYESGCPTCGATTQQVLEISGAIIP